MGARLRERSAIRVFTDGSSFNNGQKDPSKPQASACGIVIARVKFIDNVASEYETLFTGGAFFPDQTISYAELKGAIMGLVKGRSMFPDEDFELHSDSQFVIKGWNEWLPGWKRRGWKNAAGEEVGQLPLWKQMDQLMAHYDGVTLHHVKGHTKSKSVYAQLNNLADEIAGAKLAAALPIFLKGEGKKK